VFYEQINGWMDDDNDNLDVLLTMTCLLNADPAAVFSGIAAAKSRSNCSPVQTVHLEADVAGSGGRETGGRVTPLDRSRRPLSSKQRRPSPGHPHNVLPTTLYLHPRIHQIQCRESQVDMKPSKSGCERAGWTTEAGFA